MGNYRREKMINVKIGRYEAIEEAGSGGFATVFRARDTVLKRDVALKVMRPLLMSDPGFVARFRREAEVAANLDHAHIVPVYDYGEENGRLFLVMKWLGGGSVADRLVGGPMPFNQVVTWTEQVAAGLDFAHSRGVVHRDIKPGNIMLDEQGRAVLADFGVVRAVASSTISQSLSGGILGTPAYVSPEVWNGEEAIPASDIYALTCVVYELITGKRLFDGPTPFAIMALHAKPAVWPEQWPEGVPLGLVPLLEKGVAKEALTRYRTAGELGRVLQELATDRWAEPYRQMHLAFANQKWDDTIALGERIVQENARYRDTAALLAQATQKKAESERQNWITGWRYQAEQALQAGDIVAARMARQQWQQLHPTDPELALFRQRLQAAEQKTVRQPEATTPQAVSEEKRPVAPPKNQRSSRQLMIGLAGVVLLVLALGVGGMVALLNREPETTMTAVAVLTIPDEPIDTVPAGPIDSVGEVANGTRVDGVIFTPTATNTPIPTPMATQTPMPTATPEATVTQTRIATATPVPVAQVRVTLSSVYVRKGPGTIYDVAGYLSLGDVVTVLGRSQDALWFNVELADGRRGWLAVNVCDLVDEEMASGITTALTIPARPTNTATPTFTPTPTPTDTPYIPPPPTDTNTPMPPTDTNTPMPTLTPSPSPRNYNNLS